MKFIGWLVREIFSANSYMIIGPNGRPSRFFPLRRKRRVQRELNRLTRKYPGTYYISKDDLI